MASRKVLPALWRTRHLPREEPQAATIPVSRLQELFQRQDGHGNGREQTFSYRKWAIAIYLITTSLKSVSSMKLSRDLEITQKTAWFMAHRIRHGFIFENEGKLGGTVEADEMYVAD